MSWIPTLLVNLSQNIANFRYHGVDVVDSIIRKSQIKYKHFSPRWQVTAMDISKESLPTGYDLIFSRDALQHLPLNIVVDTLENFSRTKGSKYLLIGSYFKENANSMIKIGEYFPVNLIKPPFNLTMVMHVYDENVKHKKYLYLYDIPNYLRYVNFDSIRKELDSYSKNISLTTVL